MESLHIEFVTDGWWLVLVLAAAVGAALWYYAVHRALVSGWARIVLVVLRSLGIGLLAAVLFQPVVRFFSSREEPPRVAVVVDNSASMRIRDGRFDRSRIVRRALEQIADAFPSSAVVPLRFGRTAELLPVFALDSFRLDENATDLEAPFDFLAHRRGDNIQAVVLVTDGAYNSGAMPLYAAEDFGKPIFSVGVGDTAGIADIAVVSLVTNERGFKDVGMPVQVSFTADGISGEATLVLLDGGNEVARQRIQLAPTQRFYRHVFEYTPHNEGTRKLTARIEPVNGEYTTINNTLSEFVRVLPNERRVVLIAGAPSPDVAFISQLIGSDPSIRLRTFIQKFGAEFYGAAPTEADLRGAESIVLVGFPIASSSDALVALIADVAKRGKPILLVASQALDPRKLAVLDPVLPFSVERWNAAEMQVTCHLTERGSLHALMQPSEDRAPASDAWNDLPPIFRPEAFVIPKPGAEVLATIKVGTTSLDEPLIVARASGERRSVAILGYGLYRWKLLGEGIERVRGKQTHSPIGAFLSNSLRWLSSDENSKKVRIRTSKRHYISGEPVEFIADVQDDALRPIDDATVTVSIRSSQRQFELVLQPTGNGRYIAALQSLAGGDYSFVGRAQRSSQVLGTDEGRFTVGERSLEYQDLRKNAQLLRILAERTGGEVIDADQLDAHRLWQRIEKLPGFRPRVVTGTRTLAIWNSWLMLALAIAAFAAEWYLRKRLGLV